MTATKGAIQACIAGGFLATLLAGCMQVSAPPVQALPRQTVGPDGPAHNLQAACVEDYQPGVDYFPDKVAIRHSSQLQVEYGPNFKRVRFTPSVATGEVLDFLLVQCGTPAPPHGPHVPVIQVPIQRLVTGNSAILGALDELGMVDVLVGSENVRNATVPAVRERIQAGRVHDMWGYGHASIEQVMAVRPDVYLSFYSAYPAANMHPRLWELGARAVPQADHHETHPLGRAEWLKLLALLGNREARANDRFDRIEAEYQRLAALVQDVPMRPAVMSGFAAGRATFETFGAANQRAQLIRDAGGDYVLGDASPSSLLYVPFESIYADGAAADVWLGTLGGQPDIDAWTRTNPLHGWFRPAATGQVYAWDRGYTGAWASPYQDQSMTKPHVQLAEAISALHPAVLPMAEGQYEFLRRLP